MAKMARIEKDFSSGGLVWNASKNTLLLVQVKNLAQKKVWTFPKGHPNPGETDQEAALREVREETGWNCEILRPLKFVHYHYTHQDILYDKTVRWFLMKPLKKTGQFDTQEIMDCRWESLEKIQGLISYPSDLALLTQLKTVLNLN